MLYVTRCHHFFVRPGVGTVEDKQRSTGCCTWSNSALEEVCYTNTMYVSMNIIITHESCIIASLWL